MTLTERCETLADIFTEIMDTNSLNEKRAIIDTIPQELKEDFEYCLTCLAGDVKFGYTFPDLSSCYLATDLITEQETIKGVLLFLQKPMLNRQFNNLYVDSHTAAVAPWSWFFEPIVNRTLKLGIGKSILPKSGFAPMLAKKFEDIKTLPSKTGFTITEKLDGNRCIARHDGIKWIFTSRNGKPMKVNFDMSDFPKEYVYDGEILSPEQTKLSMNIDTAIRNRAGDNWFPNEAHFVNNNVSFNKTSGLINSIGENKNLVYNIFDIMIDNHTYFERRHILEHSIDLITAPDIRILPVLGYTNDINVLFDISSEYLDIVTQMGGEGLMINIGDRPYEHKRTDALIKVKKTYTMDMQVVGIESGAGKYEGLVGALRVEAIDPVAGRAYSCKVGSGLSDDQRLDWALHPEKIVNKIVEVAYFSTSQDSAMRGSDIYSLRFPRLKRVRYDKESTNVE